MKAILNTVNEMIHLCNADDRIIIYDKAMNIIANGSKLNPFISRESRHHYKVSYYIREIDGQRNIYAYRI